MPHIVKPQAFASRQRRKLFMREKGRCFYCGIAMTLRNGSMTTCTRDHIVPQSRGGSGGMENMVAACFACNNARGIMDANVFLRIAHRLGHAGVIKIYHEPVNPSLSEFSRAVRRMERQIRHLVRQLSESRFPEVKVNTKLPSAKYRTTGSEATFKMADVWPQDQVSA